MINAEKTISLIKKKTKNKKQKKQLFKVLTFPFSFCEGKQLDIMSALKRRKTQYKIVINQSKPSTNTKCCRGENIDNIVSNNVLHE